MTPDERPWISPGRPPWARRPRLSDAPRWLFIAAAALILDPARAVQAITRTYDALRKDNP